ncbi:MAG: diaminopimelate epimerase Diaminopimelate epimerase Kineococcus [Actinomycetota bacterium]|jgi:diaminopimelate epimerase
MTRALKITRGYATGNAFVIFSDLNGGIDLTDAECSLLADATRGEGADGVIRAVRSERTPEGRLLLETDPDAEWFIDHRNPDGSNAELCGNALRVFVAFLMAEGLVDLTHGDRIAIGTRDGVKDIQVGSNGVFRVDLGRWKLGDATSAQNLAPVTVNGLAGANEPLNISVGRPHVVTFVDDGTLDPLVDDGIGRIRMRVDQGADRTTPSWATAAAIAALATRHLVGPGAPNNWRVDMPDGSLGVQMFPTEDGEHVSLSGTVELALSGVIEG